MPELRVNYGDTIVKPVNSSLSTLRGLRGLWGLLDYGDYGDRALLFRAEMNKLTLGRDLLDDVEFVAVAVSTGSPALAADR